MWGGGTFPLPTRLLHAYAVHTLPRNPVYTTETFFVLLFAVVCYLTSKPKHATVRRGWNVTLYCSSDTDQVQWSYQAFDNSQSRPLLTADVNEYAIHVYVDSNGTVILYSVSKTDTGIYRCEDRDEAAFAELQVLGE